MKTHPAADRFPMLDSFAFGELKESIAAHGQCLPCIVWHRDEEEILIDGRNRHKACQELEIETGFEPFYGTEKEALDLVVLLNLKRRNLTEAQKAAIAAELVPMYEDATKAARIAGNVKGGKSALQSAPTSSQEKDARSAVGQAATAVGVSRNAVSEARALQKENAEAFEAVKRGEIRSVSKARNKQRRRSTDYEKALRAVCALDDEQWEELKKERDSENS